MREKIKLTQLIDPTVMQKIQDAFSHYTGMAALTTDEHGVPITKGSGFSRFCMDITRKNPKSCANCEKCDKDGALLTKHNQRATAYTCHAGLCDFAAPIMLEGQMIGSFIGGQVRYEDVDVPRLTSIAKEYGINPSEYIQAARETNCIPMHEIQKAADFLEKIAEGLSGMAYSHHLALEESKRLEKAAKSQADFIMSMSINMENALLEWFRKLEGTINTIADKGTQEKLQLAYKDGNNIHSYIKDMLDYIKMSGQKVEIKETKYRVDDLINQIKQIANILLSGAHQIEVKSSNVPEVLFGDPGRIGQIVSKVIKILTNHNSRGHMFIEINSKKVSYATILHITICDKDCSLDENEISKLDKSFNAGGRTHDINEAETLDFSYIHLLLNQMSGKMEFEHKYGDLFVSISMPQLA